MDILLETKVPPLDDDGPYDVWLDDILTEIRELMPKGVGVDLIIPGDFCIWPDVFLGRVKSYGVDAYVDDAVN